MKHMHNWPSKPNCVPQMVKKKLIKVGDPAGGSTARPARLW